MIKNLTYYESSWLSHQKRVSIQQRYITKEIEVALHLNLNVGPDSDEDAAGGEEGEVEEEDNVLQHAVTTVGHLEAGVFVD